MEQDKQQRFLSLSRVLLATTLGGASGFLLFASGYAEDDPASRKFFGSSFESEGSYWFVVIMAQSAILGLVAALIWTKTLWLFRDAFIHDRRLQIIGFLAFYLAAYLLLLWFPQQLIETLAVNKGMPLGQKMPIAHYRAIQISFSAAQFVVALFAVAGVWLADWRIRTRIASSGSEEECLSAFLEARSFLLNLGAVLATLGAFGFLSLVVWGEALKPYVGFSWFSSPPLRVYGLYLTVLVAIPYVPAYLNLLAVGREVRDRFYPRLSPGAPDYEDREIHRRRVDALLKLQLRVKEGLKILTTILVPVATSFVYTFLGLKE